MKYKLNEQGALLCASEVCTADVCPYYETCVEAKGWFVAPVGIGDTFYAIRKWRPDWEIGEYKVENITFYKWQYVVDCGVSFGVFWADELGKTWFLTREEAEAALAEMGVCGG